MSLFGLVGCGPDVTWDGSTETVDGVQTVTNFGMPLLEEPPFSMEEINRIGGETLFDGLPFHRVSSAVQDDAGNIYVSDVGNYRIIQFDSNGTFKQSFGSRGQGPNEFGAVGGITLYGDSLYVQDTRKLTISKVDMSEQQILDAVHVEVYGRWGMDSDGTIHMASYLSLASPDYPGMTSYSRDGHVIGEFWPTYGIVPDLSGVGAFPTVHFSTNRGYYAWPYPYRIEVLKRDLSPLFNLELRDEEFLPPTKPRVVDGFNLAGSLPAQISEVIEVEEQWILVESRYSDVKKPHRVDIFDMDGKYLQYLHLEPGEGLTSYSNGVLWSTINGGLLQDMTPWVIGRRLQERR